MSRDSHRYSQVLGIRDLTRQNAGLAFSSRTTCSSRAPPDIAPALVFLSAPFRGFARIRCALEERRTSYHLPRPARALIPHPTRREVDGLSLPPDNRPGPCPGSIRATAERLAQANPALRGGLVRRTAPGGVSAWTAAYRLYFGANQSLVPLAIPEPRS
jgi:hypothetical protein